MCARMYTIIHTSNTIIYTSNVRDNNLYATTNKSLQCLLS